MNLKDPLKYFLGSATVYLVMAACSGGNGNSGIGSGAVAGRGRGLAGETMAAGGDAVASGGQPALEGGQGSTAGPADAGGMLGLGGIIDPVPVANAEPVELCAACRANSLQTITADTDTKQEVSGEVTLGAAPTDTRSTAKVADGPLFLVYADTPDIVNYYTVPLDQSCSFRASGAEDDVSGEETSSVSPLRFAPHHRAAGASMARSGSASAKLRVFANEKLCVSQVADCSCQASAKFGAQRKLTWYGYRPYQ
ncbi:MAG TPA: hypothetical protein VER04_20125 [Polyangiaceae bacterium]|nr:hypothetical protein [Polyangiaceae bacterium]